VEIDLSSLLTKILDDTVESFAEAMTPPGGNIASTRAAMYRTVRDACDKKAGIAEALSLPQPADSLSAEAEAERARQTEIEAAEERERRYEAEHNRRVPKEPLYPV
jgi:hypothetical protein